MCMVLQGTARHMEDVVAKDLRNELGVASGKRVNASSATGTSCRLTPQLRWFNIDLIGLYVNLRCIEWPIRTSTSS